MIVRRLRSELPRLFFRSSLRFLFSYGLCFSRSPLFFSVIIVLLSLVMQCLNDQVVELDEQGDAGRYIEVQPVPRWTVAIQISSLTNRKSSRPMLKPMYRRLCDFAPAFSNCRESRCWVASFAPLTPCLDIRGSLASVGFPPPAGWDLPTPHCPIWRNRSLL